LAVLALCATVCAGQGIRIQGTVKGWDGKGIAGARVRLVNAKIEAKSGADGAFELSGGGAGRAAEEMTDMIECAAEGYVTYRGVALETRDSERAVTLPRSAGTVRDADGFMRGVD
jgi:hypothetical protein